MRDSGLERLCEDLNSVSPLKTSLTYPLLQRGVSGQACSRRFSPPQALDRAWTGLRMLGILGDFLRDFLAIQICGLRFRKWIDFRLNWPKREGKQLFLVCGWSQCKIYIEYPISVYR